jgi:hypothetical protein
LAPKGHLGLFPTYSLTSYLITCVVALFGGCWLLIEVGASAVSRGEIDAEVFLVVLAALAFVVPAGRALLRTMFRGELVPHAHVVERPVVTALVFVTSATGTALIVLVASVLLTTLPEPPDGNFGGPIILAFPLYAMALLTGDLYS